MRCIQSVKSIVITIALLMNLPAFADTEILGAGSTFINPVISTWDNHFHKDTGLTVNYQSVGSTEGIKKLVARSVDFAISDIPLTAYDLKQADIVQVPVLIGGVTPVFNLPDLPSNQLKLTGDVIAKIYQGEISRWDDAEIQSLNPDLSLPSLKITPIYRSDGSGTSYVFTYYLSQSNQQWHDKIGITSRPIIIQGVEGKGSEDIANLVKSTEGAIGYLGIGYATKLGLKTPLIKNKQGRYVQPSEAAITDAVNASISDNKSSYRVLINQQGASSWPIVALSYMLLPRISENVTDTKQTLSFLDWIYDQGAVDASREGYLAIPSAMQQTEVKPALQKIVDKHGLMIRK